MGKYTGCCFFICFWGSDRSDLIQIQRVYRFISLGWLRIPRNPTIIPLHRRCPRRLFCRATLVSDHTVAARAPPADGTLSSFHAVAARAPPAEGMLLLVGDRVGDLVGDLHQLPDCCHCCHCCWPKSHLFSSET